MDKIVDSMENAYEEFVNATSSFLEATQTSGGQKGEVGDVAIQNFNQRYELFKAACDQAEEFVAYMKQSITNKCVVNETTYERTKEEFLVDDVEFEKDDVALDSPIEYPATMPMTPEFSPDHVTFEEVKVEEDDELDKK
ncbi:unnamed protein product [Fraxinus pennsylvanica]|uniref:Mediator of RNA polymerase II transcription subunit 29 n=1 Tax=Fraxinus pennsylvanica TaxID=56036 RepID=A0AAD1ZHM7_9LAMI|nr:unnamed protein product [Fraxinus pennsylvanica]